MALDFNNDFKTSLLSNYHNFVPKIVLSDRARVKNTISPTLNEINIEPTIIERDGVQQETKHLFSSVKIGDINYIFIAPKTAENDVYVSGPEPNKIYLITKTGDTISEAIALDITFNVDFFNCFEFYYNENSGQFGLVYGGYKENTYISYLKRLVLENSTITEQDETKFPTRGDFFTASCLDNGKLIVITIYQFNAIKKFCFEVDLTQEILSNENGTFTDDVFIETSEIFTGGQVVNFKSTNVGEDFYYIETIYNKGIYQTNLYDTYILGYSSFSSSQIFNSIYNTGTGLVFTSSSEDGKYKIYNSDYQMHIGDIIEINGKSEYADQFNVCNYLYYGDFVLFENDYKLYIQGTNYKITYTEENTDIELPTERIISVDFESVSDNLKSRNIKVSLNNDDGFFTSYGVNENGYEYKNFFNSTTTSLRKVKFKIGDNEVKDENGNIIFESIYTGFLNSVPDSYNGKIDITCVDGLEIMKRAICKAKKYSYINGNDYIIDLCRQAGFTDIVFETNTDYTITEIEIDRRQNVLDTIKKLLDICELKMYINRDGQIVITQRLMYKENIINLNTRHVLKVDSLELPTIEQTRNVVRIITDNEKDVYVEARDEEAIANMGYEAVMELDYTGLFAKVGKNAAIEYKVPTSSMILNALTHAAPVLAAEENAKTFVQLNCGRYPYHSRYLYLITFHQMPDGGDGFDQLLVACEYPLTFKIENNNIYACTSSLSSCVGINTYGGANGGAGGGFWGHCNYTTAYTPQLNNPGYGAVVVQNATGFSSLQIYPNSAYVPGEEYEKIPERNLFLDFRKDLIEKIEVDYGILLDDATKMYIDQFIREYDDGNHELFVYGKCESETVLGVTPQIGYPMTWWELYAIKKDLTYFNEEPETFTIVKKNTFGRYNTLVTADGVAKEFINFRRWVTGFGDNPAVGAFDYKTFTAINFGLGHTNYANVDFYWHRNTDAAKNGISALDLANKILKQVCRTMEIDTVRTTPMLFLTPEDVVYLDIPRVSGYRIIKSIKHSFKFQKTNTVGYECTVKLQEARENIDFFLIEEEVENG